MATIDARSARTCVNAMISIYDRRYGNTDITADIFTPEISEGKSGEENQAVEVSASEAPKEKSKEEIQQLFFEKFCLPAYYEGTAEEKDKTFRENVPSLSKLFAQTGILEPVELDPKQPYGPDPKPRTEFEQWKRDRRREVETNLEKKVHRKLLEDKEAAFVELTQAHLRKVNHELNPFDGLVLKIGSIFNYILRVPKPIPLYAEGKRDFYSHIFIEVYKSNDLAKEQMIAQLESFGDQLEIEPSRYQRIIFKIEGTFSKITRNPYWKAGISVVVGGACYLVVSRVIPLAGQFFKSSAFIATSSVVLSHLPIVMIQISAGVSSRVVEVAAYVASTRVYGWVFNLDSRIASIICFIIPPMGLVYWPASTIARLTTQFLYNRSHGPDVRVQDAISESLENVQDRSLADKQLKAHMKAYRAWMYLVEQGSQKKLFKLPAAN